MVKFSFVPAEGKFYDCFEQASANLVEGARLLEHLLDHYENAEEQVKQITAREQQGDLIVHEVTNLLPRTLITPIDLEDILRLIEAEDDAMDAVEEAATRMLIYQIAEVIPPAQELAHLIVASTQELNAAFQILREKQRFDEVHERIVQINTIEDRADEALDRGLRELVAHHQDLFDFIRWKEILGLLEDTTDRLEDAGDVLQRVIIANA